MSTQFRSDDSVKWWLGFGNGSDGDLVVSSNTTDAPIDSSCSGTLGSNSLSATNASFSPGQAVLIHQTRGTGAGNWQLNQISAYTAGTITLKKPLAYTFTDSGASQAQVLVLKQYNNVTVNSGITWTAKAWNGDVGGILAFLCKNIVSGPGTITASARGFRGGQSGNSDSQAYCGEGSGQDRTMNVANPAGSGGGFNHVHSAGGGNAQTIVNPANTGVIGSSEYNAELTSAGFGGGGGGGASGNGGTAGGNGGGMIFIFAKELSSTNQIRITNNGGTSGNASNGRAGSGGAGGCTLIKADTASLGSGVITASAGGIGAGNFSNNTVGSVGRIHLDYKTSFTGTTTPTISTRQDSTIRSGGGASFMYTNFI